MMKRLVKNKSCLVLLNDEIVQKRKFKQILNELFEKNYLPKIKREKPCFSL